MNLHKDSRNFEKIIEQTASITGFDTLLVEKDYYITIFLSDINQISSELIFKGGTAYSKTMGNYHRMSEDIDFLLNNSKDATRGERKLLIAKIEKFLDGFAKEHGLLYLQDKREAHNENKQYSYSFQYSSLFADKGEIYLDITLGDNTVCIPEQKPLLHKFINPITNAPLFEVNKTQVYSSQEILAEKLRAAITRKTIAPRDFFDIHDAITRGFNFNNADFLKIFAAKICHFKKTDDLTKIKNLKHNLGRDVAEINAMKNRIELELLPVISIEKRKSFDIDKALDEINKTMQGMAALKLRS